MLSGMEALGVAGIISLGPGLQEPSPSEEAPTALLYCGHLLSPLQAWSIFKQPNQRVLYATCNMFWDIWNRLPFYSMGELHLKYPTFIG